MGGASSSLTAEQSVEITKKIKDKYESLIASGESDEKVQQLLTAEYNSIVASFCEEAAKAPAPESAGGGSSKKSHKSPTPSGTNSRRNSRTDPAGSNSSRRNSRTASMSPRRDVQETSSKRVVKVETVDIHAKHNSHKGGATIGLSQSSSGKAVGVGSSHKGGSGKIVGGARRRSFDQPPRKPASGSAKAPPPTISEHKEAAPASPPSVVAVAADGSSKKGSHDSPVAASAAAEATATDAAAVAGGGGEGTAAAASQPQADSWDSVSLQPYCNVCKMAFKSMPFLDRHKKYSDLHARNVKKNEGAADDGESPFPVTQSGKLAPTQIEGKHYKLIYSGSKLFWRTQAQVDLNFYHHILPHTIEIISYDAVKCKEINRLYLEHMRLMDIITAFNKAHKPDANDHHAEPQPTEEHEIIARFILARLQMSSPSLQVTATPSSSVAPSTAAEVTGQPKMEFVKLSSDDYTDAQSPVLDKPPIILVPVSVSRRRRTSSDEISATMRSLDSDRAALVEATGNAQRVANLVYTSATGLARKKWWSDFNPVRKRWVFAIRRVIRQKHVAETKQILKEREAARKEREGASGKRVKRTVSKEV